MESDINTKLLLEIDFVLLSHIQCPVTLFPLNSDEQVIIESLEDLPLDQEFLTENNNKVFKKNKHEAILTSPIGEKLEIKIDNKDEIIVPVLLDRSRASLDPALTQTAEAVLEDLTGKSLFSGIPIFLENFNSGKLIFSLKEIPLDETYCTEDGHTIKRNQSNQFFIDGVQYEPANETHLLSGEPLLPSNGGSRERSRSRSNSLPSFANRFKSKSFSLITSPTKPTQADSDWNFMVSVDENNALLVTELQTFDDIMETARKRKTETEERFTKMMERYSLHYAHNDKLADDTQTTDSTTSHELEPLLDKIDDDCPLYQTLYFFNLVKSLQGNKIAANAVKSVPVQSEEQSTSQNKSPGKAAQEKGKSKSFSKPK
mmetsp:Transcript_10140/g.13918  ORF Transcript_10140/g.13918 Transcript_10140/m.13918 type:complete len:373 (-) Transcript_10140:749-1867(-)